MKLANKNVLPTKILLEKPEEKEKKTHSGLILPSTADKVTSMGTAILVGEGTESVPMPVKVGDKLMFPPRAVIKVEIDDKIYWLLSIQDVILYWS